MPWSLSTFSSRIFTASVSPGSAPSTKKGPLRGLSPGAMLSVSPGFLIALPKQSTVLASRMSPDFSRATGVYEAANVYLSSLGFTSYRTICGSDWGQAAADNTRNGRKVFIPVDSSDEDYIRQYEPVIRSQEGAT